MLHIQTYKYVHQNTINLKSGHKILPELYLKNHFHQQ